MNSLLRHLRIADLELFISAARLSSVSKAALIHHISQSSASAAIQRVEAAFDRSLCRHEKRYFRLTQEGHILIPKIDEWLKQFKEQIAANIERPVRLATTRAMARVVLPNILSIEKIDLQLLRPDKAYAAVLKDEADLAIVPDNAVWNDVCAIEVGFGSFGLYSSRPDTQLSPVLLPENQIEILSFMQRWNKMYDKPIEIKARIPSWSLIADICANSSDIGFLPDFLAIKIGLYPVSWQPPTSRFKVLALYRLPDANLQQRINRLTDLCKLIFSNGQPVVS